jgi:predicted dehydrogenase
MKALLAGFGGIGANVYYPELQKIGYEVEVLDMAVPTATYKNVSEITQAYDLAVVCTPNFTHGPIAERLAELGTKHIFVDKPGLSDSWEWNRLRYKYTNTFFHLVKNNLYRDNYGEVLDLMKTKDVIGVDINWINNNRIPNPGSWFTTKARAFGGISRDLMPHLYCFAVKLFGEDVLKKTIFRQRSYQRWNMNTISSTDYGTVNIGGIYDVDDVALALAIVDGISVKLYAAWKEGYDKQSITLYFRDGTTYEWVFGLCPSEAYGKMLQDTTDEHMLDLEIHKFLERFDD